MNGNHTKVICLFDSGSQSSFVTKNVADGLGLSGPKEHVFVSTFENSGHREILRRISLWLKGFLPQSSSKQVEAYCMRTICGTLEANIYVPLTTALHLVMCSVVSGTQN
ncbi:hypothetical protein T11_1613 [Trichinella zimbabwensis]|uniref:DUF1758 domain-containing protein n=1 Tax=Trichinella zimbabwensis TaxID=268475 RepID=A0A0V1HVI4_9BILA|nr:hypothetical protein T11_1613 [Trichinella zimbabwensis]